MTVLVDTSVWVTYLRQGAAGPAGAVDGLLARGEALVCGPVVAELLAGARRAERGDLWALLAGLPWAELGRAQWQQVGEVAARLREQGATVALTDIEIAVAATGASASVWSRDADFDRIAAVLPALRRFTP